MAANPPETMSYCGHREYLSLVYSLSFRKKCTSNEVKIVLGCDLDFDTIDWRIKSLPPLEFTYSRVMERVVVSKIE